MITDALLSLIALPVGWVVAALPSWSLVPSGDYTQWVKGLQFLNTLLPISEIVICFSTYVGLGVALWGLKWILKIADWIMDVIP